MVTWHVPGLNVLLSRCSPSCVESALLHVGDINPARAVDVVGSDGNATFIDIRSSREKEAVGVPDVPSSAKGRFVELEMASVDRRLRGQLRNVDAVEAQVHNSLVFQ